MTKTLVTNTYPSLQLRLSYHRYLALNDLVNEIFPGERVAPEFNDWNYWKVDLPKIELPDLPLAPNNYGMGSSTSLLSSTTSVAKRVVSLTHSSSSSSIQPTSPTSTPADSKGKRASYEKSSYASAFLGRNETWTSDDEFQDQQYTQDDAARQNSTDDSRRTRETSPSVLSALVPSRLIRAVRSGNTQSQSPQSPEVKSVTGLSPSSPSMVGADASSPSIPPLEGLTRTDDNAVPSSRKTLDQGSDDLATVKKEEVDGEKTEEGYGEEEEYQGDYEDAEYADEEDQGEMDDEDDEYLEQIEEEPFL